MFERNFNIQGVVMVVFLETFQAYDIDTLKTLQKPILSLVVFFLRSRLHLTPTRTTTLGIPFWAFSVFNISIWRGEKRKQQGIFFSHTHWGPVRQMQSSHSLGISNNLALHPIIPANVCIHWQRKGELNWSMNLFKVCPQCESGNGTFLSIGKDE